MNSRPLWNLLGCLWLPQGGWLLKINSGCDLNEFDRMNMNDTECLHLDCHSQQRPHVTACQPFPARIYGGCFYIINVMFLEN